MQETSKTPQRLFGCAEQTANSLLSEIEFREEDYALVWRALLGAIGERDYFNGTVESHHAGFTSSLTTTLIIYRDKHHPERPITSLIPIWWEMHTLDSEDRKHLNDFEFCELIKFAKQIEN